MRDLFSALQEALENDELIITAVDNKHYTKLKLALIQALETEVQYNPSILNMLESDEEMDDNLRKDFSAFPEPATVFLSKDGLYSGFGIENGSQYFALLPIDNERINLILRNGLVPFLSKHLGSSEESEFLGENKHFDNEKVTIAVQRLLDTGSVAAVNGTQNAEILKSCGDSVENFDDVFIFTPHVEDKGDVNATEYAAQLAKVSLDLSAANIGASISDIYTAGDSNYICIAVANDESAVVRKLYMSEGETEDAFIESAAVELIELVGEKAMGVQSVGIEITDGIAPESEPEKNAKSKKTVAVTCGVLGIIIVLCAVLGVVYKMQGENGAFAQKIKRIFGTESTTQSAPSTTKPQTTESTTEPEPVQKPLIKLSEFMANEIVSLEKLKNSEENTSEESSSNTENEESTSSTAPETVEDKGAPEFITVNGEKIPAKEALARFVMTEMGEGYNTEAIKAQTVVIYTYLKYRDTNFVIDGVEISETYNNEVIEAVEAVFGEYLSYNGEVALTPYFGIAARKTSNAQTVFSQS
ncbi:MAG: SpoIID/LytB domain-containing protein, partial [Candidatus Fimenecus sp.]